MRTTPPGETVHAHFKNWVRLLDRSLGLDLEAELEKEEVRGFLRSAFESNGAMPPPYFVPLLMERRRALAQHTVDTLAATVRRQTGRQIPVPVPVRVNAPTPYEPTGEVRVGDEPVHGVDAPAIVVEAAEGFQCLLADRDRLIWPLCPDHGSGLHPSRTGPAAVWFCPAADHAVGPVLTV
ncbi:hypothetical protein ACIQM4_25950 [Streptomyces sp. NPDC091272]|uniref:hypothetical protein n=1 Tax=Streptomyces sp. NPDC091272 TaxID=3365981 RepID=UPI003802EE2A